MLGPVGDLRVLLHDHLDVVLIAGGLGQSDDLTHKIDRRQRANSTHHANLERFARPIGRLMEGKICVTLVDVDNRHSD